MVKEKLNNIYYFIITVINNIIKYEVLDDSAQTAYFFMLSFLPSILVFINILPLLPFKFTPIIDAIKSTVPDYILTIINEVLKNYKQDINYTIIILSILLLIFSSSKTIAIIIKKLNTIYDIEIKRSFFVRRIFSMFLNFLFLFVVFFFLILISILHNISNLKKFFISFSTIFKKTNLFIDLLYFLLLPLLIFIIISLLYYFALPSFKQKKRIKYKYHIIGSIVSTILLIISFYLLNFYFSNISLTLSYGIIGSTIVLLFYFYVTAFLIFLGAVINKVLYTKQLDKKINLKSEIKYE